MENVFILEYLINNGYLIVYLLAHPLILSSIKQSNANFSLPHGPIFLNPTSWLNALHTEVIPKNPHEFKIASLWDMFPDSFNPFFAGCLCKY